MKYTVTLLKNIKLVFCLLLIHLSSCFNAQILTSVTKDFNNICAGGQNNFNSFRVNFSFTGSNTFILEMSDANGSFANLTTVTVNTAQSQVVTSPGYFTFSVPTNLVYGTGYKVRVRSISPESSLSTPSFTASYKIFEQAFWLNNKNQSPSVCGNSFNLSIDNHTAADPSPIQYSYLKYIWYKNGVIIPNETGTSINVNSNGVYYARVDYGVCSNSIAESRHVTVTFVTAGSTFNISSSNGAVICPPQTTVLSTTAGYNYKWYKNSVEIPGATSFSYEASEAGTYSVRVFQGTCESNSADFNLSVKSIVASIDVRLDPDVNNITAGENLKITITSTDVQQPTYEWYRNNETINLSTTNTLTTNIPGKYKAIVRQTIDCVTFLEFNFTIKEGVNPNLIPNVISINNDGENDKWQLPQEYTNPETEITILSPIGKVVLNTKNYNNTWPETEIVFKSVNPVYYYIISKDGNEIKKGTITIIK